LLSDNASITSFEPFKNELLRLPYINGVTYASSFPGAEIDWHRADVTLNEENAPYRYSSRIIAIGTEFLDVFNLKLLAGRNFDPALEGDRKTLLLNEEAVSMFGFKDVTDALGKVVFVGSRRFEVIGVINNYHFQSFRYTLQPVMYMQGYPRNPAYAIKIAKGRIDETIAMVERKWKETYPDNVFSYYFLDERFEQQYTADQQLGMITGVLTVLAIIVSLLGLFGLSLYTVSRRKKEIGIRKVLGASARSIVMMFSKDYARLFIVACVTGVPLSYLMINQWLQRYAYQMSVDWSLFIVPVVVIVLLTLITVSIRTTKAAMANPVESLKCE
jgi:putative ABC transport system permease protein